MRIDRFQRHIEYLRCGQGMDIVAAVIGFDQFFATREMREKAQFYLRIVGIQ